MHLCIGHKLVETYEVVGAEYCTQQKCLPDIFGLVAHLVERLICTEEVAGSSPVESTIKQPLRAVFVCGLEVSKLLCLRQDLKDGSMWLCHS